MRNHREIAGGCVQHRNASSRVGGAAQPRVCSHRAFTGRHLRITPAKRLVVTGFQNSLMASPHYDLVSLFYDGWGGPPLAERRALYELHAELGRDFLPAWDEKTSLRAFHRVALERLLGEFGKIGEAISDDDRPTYQPVLTKLTEHVRELFRSSNDLGHLYDPLVELIPHFDTSAD